MSAITRTTRGNRLRRGATVVAPALLILLGIGWTGFALAVATDGFARSPALADAPTLVATIAMPLTLLAVLWMALLRSGRSEQARFARVATALREENLALNQSMHSLGLHLADAQKQLGEQAKIVQQLGLDTVMRLNESSDKLASNASVIANAHDQLARSGDVALQRMDGLLAGLPRIDDVAQRLAVNFREAGLVAHQQGASLEAKLAELGEAAAKTAQTGETATASILEAIVALQEQGKETETGLLAASTQVSSAHDAALARMTSASASARDDMTSTVATVTAQMDESWRLFRDGVDTAAAQMDAKLAAARDAGDAMGAQLSAHADASDALATRITAHVADVAQQLEVLDVSVSASTGVIGRSIDDTKAQLGAFMQEVQSGNASAHQLITHAESLLLALDAVTRELDETLPHALDRMTSHGKATQTALSQLRPMLEASELVAQSTMSHVNAVQATLKSNEDQMAGHATSQQALVDRINGSLADAEAALAKLRDGADEFAEQGGARMIATLGEVRATADFGRRRSAADARKAGVGRARSDAGDRDRGDRRRVQDRDHGAADRDRRSLGARRRRRKWRRRPPDAPADHDHGHQRERRTARRRSRTGDRRIRPRFARQTGRAADRGAEIDRDRRHQDPVDRSQRHRMGCLSEGRPRRVRAPRGQADRKWRGQGNPAPLSE